MGEEGFDKAPLLVKLSNEQDQEQIEQGIVRTG
jgi:hypothetical protein